MFDEVFAPKRSERVLFLQDIPHREVGDNLLWVEEEIILVNGMKVLKNWEKKENSL
jgi:hypothetical protein